MPANIEIIEIAAPLTEKEKALLTIVGPDEDDAEEEAEPYEDDVTEAYEFLGYDDSDLDAYGWAD